MKIGFICPTVPGHLNPMTTLARQLQARGHEVVFLYTSSAAGLSCIPAEENDYVNESRSEISRLQGEDALVFSLRQVLRQTEGILNSMPAMVEKSGVDAVILDTVQFYAELAPMRLGIPYIHVAAALHFDYSGYTPYCVSGDPHETTPEACRRNREVVARFLPMISNDGIKAYASNAGLKIDWDDPRPRCPSWRGLPKPLRNSILRVHIGLRSFIILARFMTAKEGNQWIFPGND